MNDNALLIAFISFAIVTVFLLAVIAWALININYHLSRRKDK